ncbi:DUF58 domain-containing protein [Deinococcus metallilatus]|uniref:Uncharacterized protein (DUF58 family) n=1 Tax=Deinococcus metallilatus TaxID=1211322 RepID=A0ABR6MVG3_9DEIO|nr:DUF58 domain-containing protein [Deinococcus metallilatus]MBB5295924.1 uncharacterized protein (DUF58 family) [Deinococcus metallilatus]GMA14541.1 hypothetical protein GCM10025871_08720 [Deinococcus metallilatus]
MLTVLLAAFLTARRPPRVTLTRDFPPQGFEGTRLPYRVRVEVESRWPLRVLIEDPTPLSVVPGEQFVLGGLTVGRSVTERVTNLTLNRRGEYTWPGGTLRWADPLGLFWHAAPLPQPNQHGPARLEVYPGTHGLLLPDLLRPLLSEGTLSRTLGLEDPISLRGARPYLPGDPPGRVHWRLSARGGALTVRELDRTAASSVTVFLDLNGSEVFVESAVRLASSLIQEALALDLPVSVATRQGVTPTGRTPEALRAALRRLAQVQPDLAPPLIPPSRAGGNLIVLTQRAGPALVEQAMRARASASRVVIVAIPEGFYLEPGEKPRRQWVGAPETVRDLERRAGILAEAGVVVYVLRGNQSVLRLGA